MNIIESLKPLAVSIDSIKNDPHNVRSHSERNINVIKKSLETYGQRKPIVVNQDGIIEAGNGMYQAARELGWTEIAAVRVDDKEEVAKAFGIIDNKSAELAEWDLPLLKDLLQELDTGAFDMEATGFDVKEIEELVTQFHVDEEGLTDDDAIPEDVETICKTGDLWKLGNHRLLCGDATKKEDVERLMGGEKADMVFTDPPYGISIVGNQGTAGNFPGTSAPRLKAKPIIGDESPFNPSHLIDLAPIVVLWGANHYADKLPPHSKWLIWDKKDGAFEGSDLGDCEIAWTNQKGAARLLHHTWQGMYRKGEGERSKRLHPTQKPIALTEWALDIMSVINKGIVLDPYGGSGSTLIACEKLDRKCYMMEIDEHYCDVIIERWQKFTGKQAEKING